jgi:hypothetical protein
MDVVNILFSPHSSSLFIEIGDQQPQSLLFLSTLIADQKDLEEGCRERVLEIQARDESNTWLADAELSRRLDAIAEAGGDACLPPPLPDAVALGEPSPWDALPFGDRLGTGNDEIWADIETWEDMYVAADEDEYTEDARAMASGLDSGSGAALLGPEAVALADDEGPGMAGDLLAGLGAPRRRAGPGTPPPWMAQGWEGAESVLRELAEEATMEGLLAAPAEEEEEEVEEVEEGLMVGAVAEAVKVRMVAQGGEKGVVAAEESEEEVVDEEELEAEEEEEEREEEAEFEDYEALEEDEESDGEAAPAKA